MSKYWIIIIVFFSLLISCNSKQDEMNDEIKNHKNNALVQKGNVHTPDVQIERNDAIYNSRQNSITKAVAECSAAIVGINVTEVREYVVRDPFYEDPFFNQFMRRFFGDNSRGRRTRQYEVRGLGSGFIISPDGYILTNHHVAGNATKIVVTMTDGAKYDAEIIGSDMVSDVALLKIEGNDLPYLKLGSSEDLIIGEWVIAFGNPFGLFDKNAKPTVTVGVVSNNNINILHEDQPYNRVYKRMIQTDAAISSGNSGGPLVNSLGEVIGMNTIIFSTSQGRQGAGSIGIGFSIPINRVIKIIELLKDQKSINRDYYTGIEPRQLDEQLARMIKTDIIDGVVIFGMQRNSPAEKAGFELGDIIIEVDGYKINRLEDYLIATGDSFTGDKLTITINRNGSNLKKTIVLEPIPRR
ncbi:MAG: trypsin-like peptidase domain-containing protein [Candidatus Kapaibacterium sp.]|jgi:serine protease Do|nr:trypsin-like peptidase domain-containing protein [Candidatus Kapabacteria bacterium]